MSDAEARYTIDQLAAQVGISARTVRFYVAERLLPGPDSRGRAAGYSREHLLRLRLARRLVDRHLPLAEVRERLADLSVDDLRALLTEEDERAGRRSAASPKAYVSELLAEARERRVRPSPAQPSTPQPAAWAQPLPGQAPAPSPPAQSQPAARPRHAQPTTEAAPLPVQSPPSHPLLARRIAAAQTIAGPAAAGAGTMLDSAQPAVPPATWRRFSLADGVELHVRADAERHQSPLIGRLLAAADLHLPAPDAKDILP